MDRSAAQAWLRGIEARLQQAFAAEVNLHTPPASLDDRAVRERYDSISQSLGEAWQIQHGFNPYATKEWDEAAHPRDERGRFGSGGGAVAEAEASGAPGMPITLRPTWQATRAPLDTSNLTGASVNAIDPPNLSSEVAEQRLLGLYERAVAQGHAAKDANWYVDRHNLAGQWADQNGVDRQRFTDAVAATSPLTAWDLANSPRLPNLEAARAMVLAERAHPDLSAEQIRDMVPRNKGYPFLGNSAEKSVRALRGEDPNEVFSSNKIRSFNNDLTHPEHPTNVTIDTHMGRMMLDRHDDTEEAKKEVEALIQGRKLGRGPTAKTLGGYGWAADRVRAVAATKNMVPSSFQAVVWEQWRREGGAVTTRRAAKMKAEEDLTEQEVWELWQDVIKWAEAGAPADWPTDKGGKTLEGGRGRWVEEEKYNPYHEEGTGRFTSESSAGYVSLGGKPTEEGRVVGPKSGYSPRSSPEHAASIRASMVRDSEERAAKIDARMKEAQSYYDAVGEDYMKAANLQRAAIEHKYDVEDRLNQARKDFGALIPGSLGRIHALEVEQPHADAAYEQANEAVTRALKDMNDAQQGFNQAYRQEREDRALLNHELREKYINAPEGPATIIPTHVTYDPALHTRSPSTPPMNVRDGVKIVNQMIGKGAVNEVRSGTAMFEAMRPDDPWYASGRSYHTLGTGITMHPNDTSNSTVVHEMGHWVEGAIPGAAERIQAHIVSRTRTEEPRPLSEITGGNYNANEMSRPDKFADAYMGKDYGGTGPHHEFLSMSMQLMHDDPAKFARDDPQSFEFTLQLLAEARARGGDVARGGGA